MNTFGYQTWWQHNGDMSAVLLDQGWDSQFRSQYRKIFIEPQLHSMCTWYLDCSCSCTAESDRDEIEQQLGCGATKSLQRNTRSLWKGLQLLWDEVDCGLAKLMSLHPYLPPQRAAAPVLRGELTRVPCRAMPDKAFLSLRDDASTTDIDWLQGFPSSL